MVFSDQAFVFFFLPLALACCLAARGTRAFNFLILIFSLIFFYWESGLLTLILLASISLNYAGGLLVEKRKRRPLIATIICMNFALLGYFKYTAFFLGIFDFFGHASVEAYSKSVILPIGISFYTFQGVSYVVDVWRGDVKAEPNPVTFAAYNAFFPQLIAGPIVRYADVVSDFRNPNPTVDLFSMGAARFMLGLAKKLLIADMVAPIANAAFFTGEELSAGSAWLGALAFSIQIYFDFSAYSDMAIGVAMMFGIRFKENFNHPYAASTITEFWRRWHISLSSWFRDYVYIPLGGNRRGPVRTYVNLVIVFLATGFWHGAAWNFVLWGLYHGAFLIIERMTGLGGRVNEGLRLLYFFPVTIIGWVLFQVPDLSRFGDFMAAMTGFGLAGELNLSMVEALSPQATIAMTIGLVLIVAQPYYRPVGQMLQSDTPLMPIARLGAVSIFSVAAFIHILPQNFSPFLYFRF